MADPTHPPTPAEFEARTAAFLRDPEVSAQLVEYVVRARLRYSANPEAEAREMCTAPDPAVRLALTGFKLPGVETTPFEIPGLFHMAELWTRLSEDEDPTVRAYAEGRLRARSGAAWIDSDPPLSWPDPGWVEADDWAWPAWRLRCAGTARLEAVAAWDSDVIHVGAQPADYKNPERFVTTIDARSGRVLELRTYERDEVIDVPPEAAFPESEAFVRRDFAESNELQEPGSGGRTVHVSAIREQLLFGRDSGDLCHVEYLSGWYKPAIAVTPDGSHAYIVDGPELVKVQIPDPLPRARPARAPVDPTATVPAGAGAGSGRTPVVLGHPRGDLEVEGQTPLPNDSWLQLVSTGDEHVLVERSAAGDVTERYRGAGRAVWLDGNAHAVVVGISRNVFVIDTATWTRHRVRGVLAPGKFRLSADGSLVVGGPRARVVRWADGEPLWQIEDRYDHRIAADISPAGDCVAVAGLTRGRVTVFDIAGSAVVAEHAIPDLPATVSAVHLGAEHLAVIGERDGQGYLMVWRIDTGDLLFHDPKVPTAHRVAVDPQRGFAVLAGPDGISVHGLDGRSKRVFPDMNPRALEDGVNHVPGTALALTADRIVTGPRWAPILAPAAEAFQHADLRRKLVTAGLTRKPSAALATAIISALNSDDPALFALGCRLLESKFVPEGWA